MKATVKVANQKGNGLRLKPRMQSLWCLSSSILAIRNSSFKHIIQRSSVVERIGV